MATKKTSKSGKTVRAVRRTASRPKPAARPARRPPAPARPAAKPAARPAARKARPAAAAPARAPKARRYSRRDLERFRKRLLDLRDSRADTISFLAGENLNHSQREASGDLSNYGIHMADQGTDNFDRELAGIQISSNQDLIYEINEALARIDAGTYGVCEMTGELIEKARLEVVPFTRYCRRAQEEMERGRKHLRRAGPVSIASASEG